MTTRDIPADALAQQVEAYAAIPAGEALPDSTRAIVEELLQRLESGELRAAERAEDGIWRAIPWVKRGILLGFRVGKLVSSGRVASHESAGHAGFSFVDKDTYPTRAFAATDGIRIVPGGSTVRRGTYLAKGVVCMPPMYVNVGAYIGEGTMVDSHALVGSCAQIGARVHLSAAAQIGGVLEPVNASPVVIEDDVMVGGNCGVYEGTVVREKAVLAAGVILTRGTPVFDLVRQTVRRGSADAPLEIPAGAVVVPGARAVTSEWGAGQGLSLQTPVIVKYRDEKTDLATALEGWLR
jgi:2,3,4,5-tetrahydropyridine-2,6-dicarboxylate N-succinyltransferase